MSEETGPCLAVRMEGLTEEEREQAAQFQDRTFSLARADGTRSSNPRIRWLAWYYIGIDGGETDERACSRAEQLMEMSNMSDR